MSMTKKVTLIATGAALAALVAVGGTLAWFSDTKTATNVVTTGNVKILLEETDPENPKGGLVPVEGEGFKFDVLPGAHIEKDPTITNVGANDAYVRAKIEITDIKATGDHTLNDAEKATIKNKIEALFSMENHKGEDGEFNRENGFVDYQDAFTYADGYFYFSDNNFVMSPEGNKGSSDAIFSNVTFPTSWGNEMADVSFNIVVTAEAVQVDNFLPAGTEANVETLAANWPAADAE